MSIFCPYCKYEFNEKPKRNKKCPSCQKKIMLRNAKLLTEYQAIKYDEREHATINEAIASLNRKALVNYKKNGIKYVEILTGRENTCKACLALDGKRLLVEDELRNPTLPVKNCNGGYWKGHCRCCYVAVID